MKHQIVLSLILTTLSLGMNGCRGEPEAPAPRRVTLSVFATSGGQVSGVTGGIQCDEVPTSDCDEEYDISKSTEVVLVAKPNPGYKFSGWRRDCSGTNVNCKVKMTESRQVEAHFELLPPGTLLLSVRKLGDGSGRMFTVPGGIDCGTTCDAAFEKNASITIAVKADAGSVFEGWDNTCQTAPAGGRAAGDVSQPVDAICVVKLDETKTIRAKFSPAPMTLLVQKTGKGSGSVLSTPAGINCGNACKYDFPIGTTVKLTAAKNEGATFNGWGGDCASFSDEPECTVVMTKPLNVTTLFEIVPAGKVTLSVIKGGAGDGTVMSDPTGINCGANCSEPFVKGTSVTLIATPKPNYTFVGWSGDCASSGANQTCTLTLDGDKTAAAEFGTTEVLLFSEVTGSGGGTIISDVGGVACSSGCTNSFAYGTKVALVATPNATSTFMGWSGACSGASPVCSVTLDGAKNVQANFATLNRLLFVTKVGMGSGGISSNPSGMSCFGSSCSAAFVRGSSVTITAHPDGNSTFVEWGGACSGTSPTCTVVIGEENNATAKFNPKLVSIGYTRGGNGTGTVYLSSTGAACSGNCTLQVAYGVTVTLTAVPTPGHSFAGWDASGECGGSTNPSCTLTPTQTRTIKALFTNP